MVETNIKEMIKYKINITNDCKRLLLIGTFAMLIINTNYLEIKYIRENFSKVCNEK